MELKTKDEELIIIQKKKPRRIDPFFYSQCEPIAEINYKGWKIFAEPTGDIRIIDKKTNEEIRNNEASSYWDKFTDKILGLDRFEWENNSWFEVGTISPEDKFVDLMIAEHDYDSAVQRLNDVLSELKENGKLGN